MNKADARRQLKSTASTERLRAARYFVRCPSAADASALRAAVAREADGWVRRTLLRALERVERRGKGTEPSEAVTDTDRRQAGQMYSKAVEDTARLLLHEIEPVVGILRCDAEREVRDYATSRVARSVNRLDALLEALMTLSRAAKAPQYQEFELSELVRRVVDDEKHGVEVQLVGRQPFLVVADPRLVEIAVRNGLRNAVEATAASGAGPRPVVVSWGDTDREVRVSILDRAGGLPDGFERASEIGTTTKAGHLGMGLPVAKRAIESLGGRLALGPADGGARFEITWERVVLAGT